MRTQKVKPIYLSGEIIRKDPAKREIEFYAFTQERVTGQKLGISRKAMEDATPDYMEWANVREMHDKHSAVGITQTAVWDDTGCLLTVRVADDQAWKKVEEGVYKGGSVGVLPEIIRGDMAHKVLWFETSLVDRPADTGSKFLAVRSANFETDPVDQEFDAEVEEEPEVERVFDEEAWFRGVFADKMAENEYFQKQANHVYRGMDTLHQAIHHIGSSSIDDKPKAVRRAMSEAADYICRAFEPGDASRAFGTDEALQTLTESLTEAALTRAADPAPAPAADTETPAWAKEIQRVAGEQATAIERRDQEIERLTGLVTELKNQPARYQPVRFTDPVRGMERTIGDGAPQSDLAGRRQTIEARMGEIIESRRDAKLTDAQRGVLATEFGTLKASLAQVAAAEILGS